MSENSQNSGSPAPEDLLAAQNLVLEMIALGSPLEDVLRELALLVDRQEPGGMCSISLLDPGGRTMRRGAAPNFPAGLLQSVTGMPIGPRCGACGTAAYRRKRVVVEDMVSDPLFEDYRELSMRFGLRSSWSTPILSTEGFTLGT